MHGSYLVYFVKLTLDWANCKHRKNRKNSFFILYQQIIEAFFINNKKKPKKLLFSIQNENTLAKLKKHRMLK